MTRRNVYVCDICGSQRLVDDLPGAWIEVRRRHICRRCATEIAAAIPPEPDFSLDDLDFDSPIELD